MVDAVQCEERRVFRTVAEHELRCARRYGRFMSLVVGVPEGRRREQAALFSGALRETDAVLDHGSCMTILMSETDARGAQAALDRVTDRYRGLVDMLFGVASYPQDGRDVEVLLRVARRRLGHV